MIAIDILWLLAEDSLRLAPYRMRYAAQMELEDRLRALVPSFGTGTAMGESVSKLAEVIQKKRRGHGN